MEEKNCFILSEKSWFAVRKFFGTLPHDKIHPLISMLEEDIRTNAENFVLQLKKEE